MFTSFHNILLCYLVVTILFILVCIPPSKPPVLVHGPVLRMDLAHSPLPHVTTVVPAYHPWPGLRRCFHFRIRWRPWCSAHSPSRRLLGSSLHHGSICRGHLCFLGHDWPCLWCSGPLRCQAPRRSCCRHHIFRCTPLHGRDIRCKLITFFPNNYYEFVFLLFW